MATIGAAYLGIGLVYAVVNSSADDWQWSRASLWLVVTLAWPWLMIKGLMR